MTKINSIFTFFAVLFWSSFIYGQVSEVSKSTSAADSIDFEKELSIIPGETIGQKLESLLFWSVADKKRRFPHMHEIFPSIEVEAGEKVYPLETAPAIYPEFATDSLDNYINDNNIGGLIVLKNDKIQLEVYGEGVDRNSVWTSFSVGKSVTSMLLGVALKEGDIESLDDLLSKYIPELEGRDYGNVTVRQLLTMTSGIKWNEDYGDSNSDVAQMYQQPCQGTEAHILTYMKSLPSIHKPGEIFNYSTGETDLLGILIQKATGKSLSEYLSEKIWKPWGMEQDAYWLADECSLLNLGGSGLSATLRDYARLGTLMLKNGKNEENQLFADEYVKNATALLLPVDEDGSGYGYLWWRFPNGSYAAFGIFGQMIYINPNTEVVIAQFAAWPKAGSEELSAERAAFIASVEEELRE